MTAALNVGTGGLSGVSLALPDMNASEVGSLQAQDFFEVEDLDRTPKVVDKPRVRLNRSIERYLERNGRQMIVIEAIMGVDGRLSKIINVQNAANGELERLATNYANDIRFEPGEKNGRVVPFKIKLPLALNPPS